MKNNKPFSALHFGFLLLSVGFTISCSVFSNATPGVLAVSSEKAFSNSATFQTREPSPSQKPKTTSTLLSTRLILPTSTRSSATLTASERSRFRITFDYGSDAIWERLYPAYIRLESAGYSVVRYPYSDARNIIGYGDPSCLPAIGEIRKHCYPILWISTGLRKSNSASMTWRMEKRKLPFKSGMRRFFSNLPRLKDSSFAPYLAPLLPENAVARLGKGALDGAAVSPSGEDLAVATPIGVYMYRMEEAGSLREKWFVPTTIPITTVAFSPDGKTLACGSHNDLFWPGRSAASTVVMLLDPGSDTSLRIYPVGERGAEITRLAFSPDGAMLAAWIPNQPGRGRRGGFGSCIARSAKRKNQRGQFNHRG